MNYNYLEKYKKYKKKYFHAKDIERYIDIEGGTSKKKKEKSIYQIDRERKAKEKRDKKIIVKAPKKYETKLPAEVVKALSLGKDTVDNFELQALKRILDKQNPKMILKHCEGIGDKYARGTYWAKFCGRVSQNVTDPNDKLKKDMKLDPSGAIRKELLSTIKLTDPKPGNEENLRWNTFKNLAYLAGSDIKIDDKKRNNPTFLASTTAGWTLTSPHQLKKKVYGKYIVGHIFNVPGRMVKDPQDLEGKKKLSRLEIKALVAHKICCVYFIEMLMNMNTVMKMGTSQKMAKSVGNILKINDFKSTDNGQVLRLALISTHYKQSLDWNENLLSECSKTIDKWYNSYVEIKKPRLIPDEVLLPLYDDLNTPKYIANLHKLFDKSQSGNIVDKEIFVSACNFIGLLLQNKKEWINFKEKKSDVDVNYIKNKIKQRNKARDDKNYELADEIRDDLLEKGVQIEDKDGKTSWKFK